MPEPDTPTSNAASFYDSLRGDFDVGQPLLWYFLLGGIKEDRVEPIMRAVTERGFTDIEGMFDEEREGLFIIGFAERRVHTKASFAELVCSLLAFAKVNGAELKDYSASNE